MRQLEACRKVQGHYWSSWEDCAAFVHRKEQSLRVQRDDEVDLALTVALAHKLCHKDSVFRTGIVREIKVFEELVSDATPPGVQDRVDSTVGQFEDGHVGFQAMQDQNIFPGQVDRVRWAGRRLTLRFRRSTGGDLSRGLCP